MERRLKQVIISELLENLLKFAIAFFISWIILKLLLNFECTRYFILDNFKSQTDIIVGLSLLYLIYFGYVFYKKIDRYIFEELSKLIRSIKENSYKDSYKTYEFNKISETLNNKKNEIIEKDKELVKGISYISHDMKTPITVINTNISLLKNSKDLLSDKNIVRMNRIYSESEKISAYIDKIMKIAKSQLDENEVSKIKLFDLIKSMEKNIMIYSDMLEEEIEIHKEIADFNLYIYGNITNINECLIQLLNNAYDYKKEKIKIEIKVKKNLEISVIDDGDGFDGDMLKKSKKLFVTSNIGRTSGKGYGIGLYYVNNYLEKISGKLVLANGEKGAIAKMLIPVEKYHD